MSQSVCNEGTNNEERDREGAKTGRKAERREESSKRGQRTRALQQLGSTQKEEGSSSSSPGKLAGRAISLCRTRAYTRCCIVLRPVSAAADRTCSHHRHQAHRSDRVHREYKRMCCGSAHRDMLSDVPLRGRIVCWALVGVYFARAGDGGRKSLNVLFFVRLCCWASNDDNHFGDIMR